VLLICSLAFHVKFWTPCISMKIGQFTIMNFKILILKLIYLSAAIGLTPGGSTHLHINNTYNSTINNKTTWITKKNTNNKFGRVLAAHCTIQLHTVHMTYGITQSFPTRGPQNKVGVFSRTSRIINKNWEILRNSKCSWKYSENFYLQIGNTGVIFVG
jgi:hypothetical protein